MGEGEREGRGRGGEGRAGKKNYSPRPQINTLLLPIPKHITHRLIKRRKRLNPHHALRIRFNVVAVLSSGHRVLVLLSRDGSEDRQVGKSLVYDRDEST